MKRTLLVAVALIGLSACTPEEIAAVVASQAQTEVAGPAVSASVDCSTFTFTVSGYPDGTAVFVNVGSNPPWGFTVGGETWTFTPVVGGATGSVLIPEYDAAHGFDAIIDTDGGGGTVRVFDQHVDCPTG